MRRRRSRRSGKLSTTSPRTSKREKTLAELIDANVDRIAEVMDALSSRDGGIYVDGTFGAGGYSRALLDAAETGDPGAVTELADRFSAPLAFGTAGLRGPEMAGPAGMNRATVRRATQGVVAWLFEIGVDSARGVVVGRDARHGSETFNEEVVSVLSCGTSDTLRLIMGALVAKRGSC